MTPPKEHNNFSVTDLKKGSAILPRKKIKIVVLRKLGELQENTGRQCNKFKKKTT